MAKTRLAVKVAAWSTIPVSSYCMCLLKSVPLEQNRVIGDAQVDGLGRIQRANRDLRLPDRMTMPTPADTCNPPPYLAMSPK